MPFLSFLPAIKYFGHFQNPDTLAVDIYLLSAVDFARGIGRCVNDDLRSSRDGTNGEGPETPTGSPALPRMRRQYADSEEHHMKNTALVVIDLQSDITKNYRDIVEAVNAAIGWPV